jgi:hypothetical protein
MSAFKYPNSFENSRKSLKPLEGTEGLFSSFVVGRRLRGAIQFEWHPSQCETNDAKHPHIAPPGQEGQDATMNKMPRSIQNGSRRGGG